jgi:DNA repair protein RadA/Sms
VVASTEQIGSRGQRLGLLHESTELYVWQETYVDGLCRQIVQAQSSASARRDDDNDNINSNGLLGTANHPPPPRLLIVDSIQTMVCNAGGSSSAGGITQVRECVGLLLRLAKSTGIPVCLVGHVTKSGDVAGPKTVEHMVDCVLYLEGSLEGTGLHQIRMLRANKNRFGSSDEVGVYTMTDGRLLPVSDPSSLFMSHRDELMEDVEGCAVSIALEGRRALTIEVQALVTMSTEKFNRKTVDGIPLSRVQLLLGVLQKRCRMFFARQDVYLNIVAGQLRLDRREINSGMLHTQLGLCEDTSIVSLFYCIPVILFHTHLSTLFLICS